MTTADPNTDLHAEGISAAVQRTIKGRYAAEFRFKAYGLIAIALALSFLTVLFVDIIGKGYTAFVQTHVGIEVDIDPALVDPKGDGSVESLGKGDYRTLIRNAFAAQFPGLKGRKKRREFFSMLSVGSEYDLREQIMADPSMVGTKQTLWVTMSDDADVLSKGRMTEFTVREGNGILSPTGTEGEIKLLSTSNDFTGILADIKAKLAGQADSLDRTINRARERLTNIENAMIRQGVSEEQREQLTTEREGAAAELARFVEKAAGLRHRSENVGGDEALDNSLSGYIVSINGGKLIAKTVGNAEIAGEVIVPLESAADSAAGDWEITVVEAPPEARQMSDRQIAWYLALKERGLVEKQFNTTMFSAGDSREPELAGIWGAAVGSFFTLIVTLLLSFPIGVMTAVYLEEFAPKNRLTDLIEVNINNLAAVPSIVFGLLGLAVFLNFFGMPRSAPLVGGMVLTLMTLPTIIISARAALKAVPPSIREAALGMGASRLQCITHHVLPLAMPGMLTGTIIGMAQALGETAPLLMIGMVAFIVDVPGGFTDPSTVLPVQIYIWADSPERAFVERTSAAIMVLLGFLISMNLIAVVLRKRFERRW